MSDPRAAPQDIDAWLRQVLDQRIDHSLAAEAMIEDGLTPADAHTLAALSMLRHSPLSGTALLASEAGQHAVRTLSRHLDARLAELHAGADHLLPPLPLFDPTRCDAHRLALHDREVSLQVVLRHPRAALVGNLLSPEECEALIEAGRDHLQPSEVTRVADGSSAHEPTLRSSQTSFIEFDDVPQLAALSRRVAELTGRGSAMQESVAITRYDPGAQFVPHCDFFKSRSPGHALRMANGGQRIATLVLYLNDVEAGGATTLPYLNLEVRPQCGSGLFFAYRHADGTPDASSLHSGSPVLRGEKWIATVFFREAEWRRPVDVAEA